eukprot:TRINITY_DN724_c0_g1_i3.p1 TRINITY_DN724_c0_g1~~TRINITY_DN724_c0_g1_i3.p1  ORF type:complete len:581 (-),score=272.69 TRINITY_DN724_c0_g1_i3:29-1771(-)
MPPKSSSAKPASEKAPAAAAAPIGSERKEKQAAAGSSSSSSSSSSPADRDKRSQQPRREGGAGKSDSPAGGKSDGKGKQRDPNAKLSSDNPAENAVMQRINKIRAQIEDCKTKKQRINEDLDRKSELRKSEISSQQPILKELKDQNAKMTALKESQGAVRAQIKEAIRQKSLKQEEIKKTRDTLPKVKEGKDIDETLANLDVMIRDVERRLSARSYSLHEEKALIKEIETLQVAKKVYKDFNTKRASLKDDDDKIKELGAKLDASNKEFDELRAKINEQRDELKGSSTKISGSSSDAPALYKKRTELTEEIDRLRVEENNEWKALREVQQKNREENQKRWEADKAAREKERADREAERAKKYEDRKARELLEVPFEQEMANCDGLLKYLNPLAQKARSAQEASAASSPAAVAASSSSSSTPAPAPEKSTAAPEKSAAAPEGYTLITKKDDDDDSTPLSKRNKQKQTQTTAAKKPARTIKLTEEIKHGMDLFMLFDALSLIPPASFGDVDKSVTDIKAKKENYQKMSQAKIKERAEAIKQKEEEAKKQAAEKEAAPKPDPAPETSTVDATPATTEEETKAE